MLLANSFFGLETGPLDQSGSAEKNAYRLCAAWLILLLLVAAGGGGYFFYLIHPTWFMATAGALGVSFIFVSILRFVLITLGKNVRYPNEKLKLVSPTLFFKVGFLIFMGFMAAIPFTALVSRPHIEQEMQAERHRLIGEYAAAFEQVWKGDTPDAMTAKRLEIIKARIGSSELLMFQLKRVLKHGVSLLLSILVAALYPGLFLFMLRLAYNPRFTYPTRALDHYRQLILADYNKTKEECNNYIQERFKREYLIPESHTDAPFNTLPKPGYADDKAQPPPTEKQSPTQNEEPK